MGFSTFWSQVFNRNVTEIQTIQPSIITASGEHKPIPTGPSRDKFLAQANVTQLPEPSRTDPKAKRRSRGFSLSRKGEDGRKRLSYFGGSAGADKDVPAVPALPMLHANKSMYELGSSSQDLTAAPAPDVKTRRRSRGFSLSRTKSEHTVTKRKSWFGGKSSTTEPVPALPPMPVLTNARPAHPASRISGNNLTALPGHARTSSKFKEGETTARPGTAISTNDPVRPTTADSSKRHSRRLSLNRTPSQKRRSRRSSWFANSSNPDTDSDISSALPPVPALTRLDSPPSSSEHSTDYADCVDHSIFTTQTPTAEKRRSYVPKSADKGFRNTVATSVTRRYDAAEEARQSMRRSLRMQGMDSGDFEHMDPQQAAEWEKLKALMETLEKRQTSGAAVTTAPEAVEDDNDDAVSEISSNISALTELDPEDEMRGRTKERHSNAQALAALEFGVGHDG